MKRKRSRHQSGNPLKRIQTKSEADKKTGFVKKIVITAVVIILVAVVLFVVGKSLSNNVVVRYPAGIFENKEAMQATAQSLRETDGVKKVVENSNGSLDVTMTPEQYEKVKSAVEITAGSMMISAVSDASGIMNVNPNEDYTVIEVTVMRDVFNGETELKSCNLMARVYQSCNQTDNDATVTFKFIDYENEQVFRTEVYNVDGDMTSCEGEEIKIEAATD